jgi:dTDP-4-amino-4,6-dideoxygalactose transaminase
MTIPFVDLRAQHDSIRDEIDAAIAAVINRGDFVAGRDVAAFEAEWAAYCHTAHAVAVSNGTDALHLALRALGVGPGDEVIIPAHTFIATAEATTMVGATPVLVDIDPATYTIDPAAVERAITPRTRAVIPVHLYGLTADMDWLADICARHDIFLLEDACQAHGALYRDRRAGSLGDLAAFSFYPGKNLGALGDAGAITTNTVEMADRVRSLRDHGSVMKYYHAEPGFCARMDTIQAATLRVKLRYLEQWNERRRRVARWYHDRLAGLDEVVTPIESEWARHVFHLYVVRVPHRDQLIRELAAEGVATLVHYPRPVHLHSAYADLEHVPGDFPIAETATESILSLPLYPEMTESQVDYVVHALAGALHRLPTLSAAS